MQEKLKIKAIYDDFLKNVALTEEQIKILNMWLNKDSMVKISQEMSMSERSVGYEIRKIKNLFEDYYKVIMTKALSLQPYSNKSAFFCEIMSTSITNSIDRKETLKVEFKTPMVCVSFYLGGRYVQ